MACRSDVFIVNFETYFTPCFSVSIINFEHVTAGCVCVCVWVCVCVCVLFHREGFFWLQDVWYMFEGTDQRCYVVSILRCASAKFLHLGIWKYHISPPKTKTPVTTNWRENYMIYVDPRKDDILI